MKFGVQVMWMVICVVSVATLNPYMHFDSVQSKHNEKRLQPRFQKKKKEKKNTSQG